MKERRIWIAVCLGLGLGLLGAGWLLPAHLRAVDAGVILSAGRTGDALIDRGRSMLRAGRYGVAQIYVTAARQAGIPGWDRLGRDLTNQAPVNYEALFWGNDARARAGWAASPDGSSFLSFIIQQEEREAALARLGRSSSAAVQALLRCRGLKQTVLMPPSSSASGQVFDALVAESGLLLEGRHFTLSFSGQLQGLAEQADQGGDSQPMEQALLDLGSLGEALNWDQLTALVAAIPDVATLHLLAGQASGAGERMPVLFAAVQLSGRPAAVARYLAQFSQTGLQDISAALCYGADGVRALAESGRRLHQSASLRWVARIPPLAVWYDFAAEGSWRHPDLMLAIKWLAYWGAGFAFAVALHLARPPVALLELPLQVRGFHLLREFLFALGFLGGMLLLSEPFLAQESQPGGPPPRLHLPMAGGVIPAGIASLKTTIMNPTIILTLLLFFALQALLYVSCLVKLAEIRRQQVPPRMKLKLLENEEHLFDAGLYLGFVGTIVSLIFASLGLVKFSLMAAYSSTSFGIIFVVIFKIFHLRPARRKLLMEAEMMEVVAAAPPPPPAPAAAPQPV
jgi:hypothetical protein